MGLILVNWSASRLTSAGFLRERASLQHQFAGPHTFQRVAVLYVEHGGIDAVLIGAALKRNPDGTPAGPLGHLFDEITRAGDTPRAGANAVTPH